jgi:hypothetical protein
LYPYQKGFSEKALLIGVITAPGHVRARDAIRRVWQSYLTSNRISASDINGASLKFFIGELSANATAEGLGEKLEKEATENGDIVRLTGFTEHYFNLTRKTISVISWARQNGYSNLFKVDDDTFLRVDNLLALLKMEMRPQFIYAGSFVSDTPVMDNPESKWYNKDLYPYDVYPEYAGGPGYFLGSKVMDFILQKKDHLVMYRVEDAAVGIWTQDMLQVDRVNLQALTYAFECWDGPDMIYVNPVNSDEMPRLVANVVGGNMCENFSLAECQKDPCLCHPPPEECEYMANAKTWADFSNEKYVDLIPRLVQTGVASSKSSARAPAIASRK